MNDPFLRYDENRKRLLADYQKHGSLIVAFDFDNTVHDAHGNGHSFPKVVDILMRCKALGFTLICFTANPYEDFVSGFLTRNGIPFDYINQDSPNIGQSHSSRKIYYNILLDDRAGLASAFHDLDWIVSKIEFENSLQPITVYFNEV